MNAVITSTCFGSSSDCKESDCNTGDPSSIPGLGSSLGEGIGYPLQYSWASPVAQMVKNLPGMQETWVRSMVWEDPLEEGTATHTSILAWRIPMDREAWQAAVHGLAKRCTRMNNKAQIQKRYWQERWLKQEKSIFLLSCLILSEADRMPAQGEM